ncbi:MAG: hypothetical protein IIB77_06555 [Proteobacteria bacterium]|nr:hypothetical protein [Pseudomonadota bacterium]
MKATSLAPLPVGFYSHAAAWNLLIGRQPSKFESATGNAFFRAYQACQQTPDRFKAVSAATGSGKTKGALALMAHIYPAETAIVIREIKECREAYLDLCKLIGEENVAISVSKAAIKKYDAAAVLSNRPSFGRVHTDAEFAAAPVVGCTHARWKGEIENGTDRGVRLCNGQQRDLIIIDEEPELERVYVTQPEDVSKLASVITDVTRGDEARSFGFTDSHPAVAALTAVHGRMRAVKDNLNVATLLPQTDLVTYEEITAIHSLTRDDIYSRLAHLPPHDRMMLTDHLDTVREFLQAACDGRVFYSKGYRGEFYAYSYAIPPQQNTLILDGTADMNGLYTVGSSLITVDTPLADYSDVELSYIELPKPFNGLSAWDAKRIRKVRETAPFMQWFMETLLANTKAGEEILVYCAQVLLDTDLHKRFDESAQDREFYTEWKGRRIHWCHFGSGRGTNRYKDCTVYFQVRAFYKPKGAIVAKTLSHSGQRPDHKQFKRLSSGRTTDPMYVSVRDTLIACDTKQNAARTCIRHLNDTGKAKAARLYFVSDNLTQIERYQHQMFPKSPKIHLIVDSEIDTENSTGPERLAHLLATSDSVLLESGQLSDQTGINSRKLSKAFGNPAVRAVMRTKGWRKQTRKQAGLTGKGNVWIRNAPSTSS